MDKAIEYLESRRLFLSAIDDSILNSNQQNMRICELKLLHESLSQLQAHKAKINELKEWCKDHSRNTAATKYDKYWKGYQESAIFVLQKLEELQKST